MKHCEVLDILAVIFGFIKLFVKTENIQNLQKVKYSLLILLRNPLQNSQNNSLKLVASLKPVQHEMMHAECIKWSHVAFLWFHTRFWENRLINVELIIQIFKTAGNKDPDVNFLISWGEKAVNSAHFLLTVL